MSLRLVLAATLSLVAGGAQAALVDNGAVARTAYPAAPTFTFAAGAGTGTIGFNVNGFNTVDGENAISGGVDYSDLLTVSLNDVDILRGYFVLGGIGANRVLFQRPSTIVGTPVSNGIDMGGRVNVFTAGVDLLEGVNTLRFSYSTPNGQAFADESFSVSDITIAGNAPSAVGDVPEPATWATMMLGFGLAGAALRRRRHGRVVTA